MDRHDDDLWDERSFLKIIYDVWISQNCCCCLWALIAMMCGCCMISGFASLFR